MSSERSARKRITVVEMGHTRGKIAELYGGFGDWFKKAFTELSAGIEINVVAVESTDAHHLMRDAGVVLTGAYEGVYDPLPWRKRFDAEMAKLLECDVPVLGVCFGHQYLNELLGGEVEYRPDTEELGWYEVELTGAGENDPLFAGMSKRFGVYQTHQDMVTKAAEGIVVLARSEAVQVQAFRWGDRVWGVQFHPEMTAEITATALREEIKESLERGDRGRAEKIEKGLQLVEKPNVGRRVLQNFARVCTTKEK